MLGSVCPARRRRTDDRRYVVEEDQMGSEVVLYTLNTEARTPT
jgi:hypothetical protein